MRKHLLYCLLALLPVLNAPVAALAQTEASSRQQGFTSWFILQNKQMVIRSGEVVMPMNQDAQLYNGVRIDHKTGTLTLLGGSKLALQDGEAVNLSGEMVNAAKATSLGLTPVVLPAASAAEVAAHPMPAAAPVAFTYQSAPPVNGKLKGVVELGASGFNLFIIRVDKQQNWKLEKSEFGNSLVLENLATDEDVRRGLKSYIGQMLDYGVGARDIHFVVSSGAALADVTRKIVAGLKELGYVVNTVTPEQEGTFGLRAALPATYASKAFVADIGSGNTKISWVQSGGTPKAVDTFGSKYFQKGIPDADVTREVTAAARQVPAAQHNTCFIIGGVPYELAKAARQGQERYTVLSAPSAYAAMPNAKTKAGVTIYRALADATGCQQFVFDWDANFTIGYLLNLK